MRALKHKPSISDHPDGMDAAGIIAEIAEYEANAIRKGRQRDFWKRNSKERQEALASIFDAWRRK